MDALQTGTMPGAGTFKCEECGYTLSLAARDHLPACPSCSGRDFARASLFAVPGADDPGALAGAEAPDPAVRARVEAPGQYVAWEQGGGLLTFRLEGEWTRIGRSLAADVRFDDPTVSRRHALLVRAPDGVRILDDRSLNGVWVNGERVEWSALHDGDEILVGQHVLRFLDVTGAPQEGVRESSSTPGS